jgi:putative oxidoreductase
MELTEQLADLGLLLLRLVVGLTFAGHGAQKAFGWWNGPGRTGWTAAVAGMGFRPAPLWAAFSIAAELGGGLLLAAGLLSPIAVMAIAGQSVVIILKAHWAKGFWNRNGGYEFPLALATAAIAVGLIGPGALSVDAAVGFIPPAEVRILLIVIGLVGGALSYALSLLPAGAPTTPRG